MESTPKYSSVCLFGPNATSLPKLSPEESTTTLITRILDPQDNISTVIKQLVIGDWPEKKVEIQILCKVLGSLKDLENFSWNAKSYIPTQLLSLFHSQFPKARLCVSNLGRGGKIGGPHGVSMDIDLLTSPQLYSLEYTVLCENPRTNSSEFPILTQILLQSRNLRILRLACKMDDRFQLADYKTIYAKFDTNALGPFNLNLQQGVSFPSIEELKFLSEDFGYGYQLYQLTSAHCLAMKSSIDLAQLTTLDLGQLAPHAFFAEVNDNVRNLKSLSFTIQNQSQSKQDPLYLESSAVQFLDGIVALQELNIRDASRTFYPNLWLSIQRHGPSLRKLTLDVSEYQNKDVPGWAEPQFIQLIQHCPQLSSLAIHVSLQEAPEHSVNRSLIWPDRPFFKLCQFSNLQSLTITMTLPSPLFRQPLLSKATIREMADLLFCDFFQENQGAELRTLELKVQRLYPGPFDENALETALVNVVRLPGNAAPRFRGGGYESVCESGLAAL